MTSETLQGALKTRPFRAFVLRLDDGREVRVSHPELIAHQSGTRSAAVMQGDGLLLVDLPRVVALSPCGAKTDADWPADFA